MAKKPEDNQFGATKSSQAWAVASCLTASLLVPSKSDAQTTRKQGGGTQASQGTIPVRSMHVVMSATDGKLLFKLDESATVKAFTALLPLELTLEDYAASEKITYLPCKLTAHGAPEGYTPVEGDLAYYAPWGNLAIFHKNAPYSPGLVKLGTLLSGMNTLRKSGTTKVWIELEHQV